MPLEARPAWVDGEPLAPRGSIGVAGTESITIALIGSALLIGAWKRFAHRPI
jgi:hypothetical protein